VTLDAAVGQSGAVVHVGARPVDAAWSAAAACVARQAAGWRAPSHDAPSFLAVEHVVTLDAQPAISAPQGPPPAPRPLAAERLTLPNGLDVWLVPMPRSPTWR
jgi:anti-sigma factor ChrR (cupin superfamily)